MSFQLYEIFGWANYEDKKISDCQELEEGRGMNRWSTDDFEGSENTLYDTIMMDTCYYTLIQTHKM